MKKLMLFSLIGLVLLACSQLKKESAIQDIQTTTDATGRRIDPVLAGDLYSNGNGKIIKTADYRFQVNNVKKSQELIEVAVRKYSAYIASSALQLENPLLEEHITIRVLSEYFEDLLKEIDTEALYVNQRKITTDDVGKEFVDLESRLKTKREVEKRYGEILRSNTGTIDELLKAEQKIGELHEEIEATISRMNFLRDQVRYSTINLEFYQTVSQQVAAAPGPDLSRKFATAFAAGFAGAVELVIALTYLWPLLIVILFSFMVWRRRKLNAIKLN
jgi:hypothetical protein